jgi:hypothetical protein
LPAQRTEPCASSLLIADTVPQFEHSSR